MPWHFSNWHNFWNYYPAVANNDAVDASEVGAMTFNVFGNDSDPYNYQLTLHYVDVGAGWIAVSVGDTVTLASGAELTYLGGGSFSYDANGAFDSLAEGETAPDSFNYYISGYAGSDTATVTITVTGTANGPVAVADVGAGGEHEAVTVDALSNDTLGENSTSLTIVSATAPAGEGSASVVDGKVVFDPGTDFDHLAEGEEASVVVSYTLEDDLGDQSTANITINITGSNDGPVAVADAAAGGENEVLVVDAKANDTDADDGAALTVVSATAPAGEGSASIVDGSIVFDPGSDFDYLEAGQQTTVTVAYTVQDEHDEQSTGEVTITITGTNDDPVANSDTGSTDEGIPVLIDALGNDTDADGPNTLSISGAEVTSGLGSVSVVDGQLRYDPGDDYDYLTDGDSEEVTISYTVSDGAGGTATASATVTVHGVNGAPVAVNDSANAVEDQSVSGSVLTNDSDGDGDSLTVTSVSFGETDVAAGNSIQGVYGTLTLNADGSYTYVADADALDEMSSASGLTDTFEYSISDGSNTATATLTVNVSLADDAVTTVGSATRASTLHGDQNGRSGAEDTIIGGDKGDVIYGLAGADTLSGGKGVDYLHGGAGADKLLGGEGNDHLFGGAGNDRLEGGTGDDRLTGDAGNDTFVFDLTSAKDTVTDFDVGKDKIQLNGVTIQSQTVVDVDRDGVLDLRLTTQGGTITLLGVSNPLTSDDFV